MLGERNPANTPLALLPHPTKQEIFDAVVQHAAKMPRQCYGDSGCLYRDETGNACFIGGLLTDEEAGRLGSWDYSSGIGFIFDGNPELIPERFRQDDDAETFLRNLQSVHDSNPEMSVWPDRLKSFARRWRLDESEVDRAFNIAQ